MFPVSEWPQSGRIETTKNARPPIVGDNRLNRRLGHHRGWGAVAALALVQALTVFHLAWGRETSTAASAIGNPKQLKSLNDIRGARFESLVQGSVLFSVDDPRSPDVPYTKKFGIADSEGRVVVPPAFEAIFPAPIGTGLLARQGTEVGLVDQAGRFVRSQELSALAERGLVPVATLTGSRSILVKAGSDRSPRFGVVDRAGRWVVEPDYHRIYEREGTLFGCRSSVSCELIPFGAAIKVSSAATFWEPLTAKLGIEKRQCAGGPCYALVRLDGSAAIDELFDLLESAGSEHAFFVRQGGSNAGLFKFKQAAIAAEIAVQRRFGAERPLFSEGRAFACRVGTIEERNLSTLNAYVCNYINDQGVPLTSVNYVVGSQFSKGRAAACRAAKVDGRPLSLCVWLDSKGNESAKTPWVDGVSVMASDENLAVLQIATGYRFFYRDGRLLDFPFQ